MTEKQRRRGVAVMAEVVAVLARYSGLRVSPIVDHEDGVLALTVHIETDGQAGLQVLSLADELRYVSDVAQVRAICSSYDIEPEKLEALLPALSAPQQKLSLTVPEIEALMHVLCEGTASADPPTDNDKLLDMALTKLAHLARAMGGTA